MVTSSQPAPHSSQATLDASASLEPLVIGNRVTAWVGSLLAVHALAVNLLRLEAVAHPKVLVLATVVLLIWTVGRSQAPRHVDSPQFRWWLWADVVVTALLVGCSRWVLGASVLAHSHLTITVFWLVAAPMAVAVWGGLVPGLIAAVGIALLAFLQSPGIRPDNWSVLIAVPLAAGAMGGLINQLRATMAQRDAEQRHAAALAERDRLGRIVHDGTLQVLALVEREGKSLGPKGERLAVLASAQEAKLRTLLQDRTVDATASPDAHTEVDIVTMLERHQSEVVTVSAMAGELTVAADRAEELDQAVGELISNVVKHAGPGARAWILIEEEDGQAVISLRDNGAGMTAEQVQAARARGRMGIANSVLGRMQSLGGSATVMSRPGRGTEWELRLPVATR